MRLTAIPAPIGVVALAAHIAAHATATQALQLWCERRWPRPGTAVRARVLSDEPAPDGAPALGPGTGWRYRAVQLMWGDTVLSDAENWYLPHHLPDAMRDSLRTSQVPFGAVIAPLRPRRVTIGIATLRPPGVPEPAVLRLRAVVTTAALGVIAEVSECYRATLLAG